MMLSICLSLCVCSSVFCEIY